MSTLTLSDEDLAEKFRKEHCEQFHILVRMHLSFVLDLNTEENECKSDKTKVKKWKLVPFGKKIKSTDTSEGPPLTQEGICQVYQLIEYLKKEQNLKVEGIFRRTGSLNRQNELRSLLNQGVKIDLDSGIYSVHDCASVLKQFLSELPDPLLTESHFPAYCQIAELCGVTQKSTMEEKLLEALQLILLLLSPENKTLLRDILNLLHLTASYEYSNKMSPDNLATLFTPHLLCPRKLSAEQLHSNAQNLCGIIAFMIRHSDAIFKIPKKLSVDFRVRFEKKLQSNMCLNESVSDQYAANTVFTFLDQERTAKENESNPTETALAQLYAYIQGLPESSKKKKLVKQFNKENGHGTPLQVLRSSAVKSNRSIGDSIKKHINKKLTRSTKKLSFAQQRSSSEEVLNTPPQGILSKARLFCTNCDSSPEKELSENSKLTTIEDMSPKVNCNPRKSLSEPNLTNEHIVCSNISYLTSTPACIPHRSCMDSLLTPNQSNRKSMSPITKSTQRMTRAMQETMMTPRSRKPVLLVCGSNLNNLPSMESRQMFVSNQNINEIDDEDDDKNSKVLSNETSLTSTFREYMGSRDMLVQSNSLEDSSFSSRTDDFTSEINDLSESVLTKSLLNCLNGESPNCDDVNIESEEKEFVLKPKQFDENGQPIVFETSF